MTCTTHALVVAGSFIGPKGRPREGRQPPSPSWFASDPYAFPAGWLPRCIGIRTRATGFQPGGRVAAVRRLCDGGRTARIPVRNSEGAAATAAHSEWEAFQ